MDNKPFVDDFLCTNMHKYEHGAFAGTGKVWKGDFEYPEQGIVHQPLPCRRTCCTKIGHQMTSALCVLLFVFLLSLGFLACEAESATVGAYSLDAGHTTIVPHEWEKKRGVYGLQNMTLDDLLDNR